MNYLKVISSVLTPVAAGATYEAFDSMRVTFVNFLAPADSPTGQATTGLLKASKSYPIGKDPEVGSIGRGSIHHYDTTDYQIGSSGRTVKTITVVALEDENPVVVANKMLENANACVLLNGQPTIKLKDILRKSEPAVKPEPAVKVGP